VIIVSSKTRDYWDESWLNRPSDNINSIMQSMLRQDDIAKERVLDVGCGSLDFTAFSSAQNFIGLDISIEALMLAKAFDRRLVLGTAENMPFRSNFFDLVISIDTVTVLGKDYYKGLEEITRVAKKEIIFNVAHLDQTRRMKMADRDSELRLSDFGFAVILETPGLPDRAYFNEKGIGLLLNDLGLEPEEIVTLTIADQLDLLSPFRSRNTVTNLDCNQTIFVRALKRK
jgi:SAM-dependent methyltransferase